MFAFILIKESQRNWTLKVFKFCIIPALLRIACGNIHRSYALLLLTYIYCLLRTFVCNSAHGVIVTFLLWDFFSAGFHSLKLIVLTFIEFISILAIDFYTSVSTELV